MLRRALLAVALLALPSAAQAQTTATTTYSGAGQYTFTVPAGVTSVTLTAIGAAGGSTCSASSGGTPGWP